MPANPLSTAIRDTLWPYLEGLGFKKATDRKFAREHGGIIQHVWVDANGVAHAKSTRITLCCTFPFAPSNSYLDPHGFVIRGGRTFDMSSEAAAQASLKAIMGSLQHADLARLEKMSGLDVMIEALLPYPAWHVDYSQLVARWVQWDAGLVAQAEQVRKELGLV